MSIFYLRVCNDDGCEVHTYRPTGNIFFSGRSNFIFVYFRDFFYRIPDIPISKVTENICNVLKCV